MWFFRLKRTFFHFASSIAAVLSCLLLLHFAFPELISLPRRPETILAVLGIALVVSAVSAILGGFYSSREIRSRFEEITLGAKNLAYGHLNYRLQYTGSSEFDGIIQAFNEMASRLEEQVGALQKLAQENEQLIQETRVTAISEERQRLARDLHDAVSQQLFAISMMAATASRLAEKNPEKTAGLIAEISQAATRAQAEMRALLLQLRPLTLQDENLSQALASLAGELESRQTIKCEVDLDSVSLPRNIENQLFRVAQEGLSNVLRHAQADRVRISLKVSEDPPRATLVIEDNGKGFLMDRIPQSSLGVRSIKERCTLMGGTAQWLSAPGQGTRLEIRVPLSHEGEAKER